ncbi:MAG: hypothetical protein DRP41_00345 [Thermodesulfobacteriota bacterium]|nr:MAG: hypothetical protein DRP41_00345 [Thermodesulfobacteriota bacterium]
MGEKSFKTIVHEKIVLKLIEEVERLKKERDQMRLEALRMLDLYLKEKRERERLQKENAKLRCI